MSPLTHLLASWIIAAKTTNNPRDCRLVTLAGVVPDIDGLGLAVDLANGALGRKPTIYYALYHHVLFHGAFGALLTAGLCACLARRRLRVALLCLLVFHLHLLCDFVGSRGPGPEDLWPIYYFGPFSKDPMWVWRGQWWLDGWQNRIICTTLFAIALWLPVSCGHSVVGVFNRRLDTVVVGVLRKWRGNLRRGAVSPGEPPPAAPAGG
jgi:hypothetical protein